MMHPQPYGGLEFFARAPSSTMKEFTQAPRKRINEGLSPRRVRAGTVVCDFVLFSQVVVACWCRGVVPSGDDGTCKSARVPFVQCPLGAICRCAIAYDLYDLRCRSSFRHCSSQPYYNRRAPSLTSIPPSFPPSPLHVSGVVGH